MLQFKGKLAYDLKRITKIGITEIILDECLFNAGDEVEITIKKVAETQTLRNKVARRINPRN